MIPEIGAWGVSHMVNFNPNPGGNNCKSCSCSSPHVWGENMQANSSNHPDVPGTHTLAENLRGCGPWAMSLALLPFRARNPLWAVLWVTGIVCGKQPCRYPRCTCVNIFGSLRAGNHLGSSKLKNKQKSLFLFMGECLGCLYQTSTFQGPHARFPC